MEQKRKILIIFLVFIGVCSFCSSSFASSVVSTNYATLLEYPSIPIQDIETEYPGRNYFALFYVGSDGNLYGKFFILNEGCYFTVEKGILEPHNADGSLIGNEKCGTQVYYSYQLREWRSMDEAICRQHIGSLTDYAYLSNQDVKDGSGKVLFTKTPTGLVLIQLRAGQQAQKELLEKLTILVPVGVVIMTTFLLVYLVRCKKWGISL